MVLLLVQDGKLSLGDDIRKYIPELPDYSQPITIAQLLGHTSGLRDWRQIATFAGWPPGDRIYGLDDILRIAVRQKSLNHAPGAAWSYTNTGYDLLAIMVGRVSGKSLADLSRERIFQPLGMTHTHWREDFRRITPGRAIAYTPTADGYREFMPLEKGYGPGGLLTTVTLPLDSNVERELISEFIN
jgi:CubicO group peptidase (beta-lactamase class C family)